MDKALLYKEWKKTRFFAIGIIVTGSLLMLYIFLSIGRSFRLVGMEHLWDVVVNKKQFFFREIKYFPTLAGVCMAISQFVPEMIQKRIKLTLHLPLKENRIIRIMLAYGLAVLMISFLIQHIALCIFSWQYFPAEFLTSALETVSSWFIAGFISYLLVASIVLESSWRRRIIYIVMGLATVRLCFLSAMPGAMVPMIWLEVCFIVLLFPLSLLSVHRFKSGNLG